MAVVSDGSMETAAIPAAISQQDPLHLILSGSWTARLLGVLPQQLDQLQTPPGAKLTADGTQVQAMDTAGAWVLQKLINRLECEGTCGSLTSWNTLPKANGWTHLLAC